MALLGAAAVYPECASKKTAAAFITKVLADKEHAYWKSGGSKLAAQAMAIAYELTS